MSEFSQEQQAFHWLAKCLSDMGQAVLTDSDGNRVDYDEWMRLNEEAEDKQKPVKIGWHFDFWRSPR